MNMIDVIDETIRSLGASEDNIKDARFHSIAQHIRTKEDKELIFRELTEEEATRYKGMAVLFIAALLSNPTVLNKMIEDYKKQIASN